MASTARDEFITLNGVRFHYREWGDAGAPALVLLHGFGDQARALDHLAAALADRYRVLVLDQRGHGETEWSADYRWQTFVDDLAAFIEAVAPPPVTLVGHSMGGVMAFLYASRRPETVTRLVIVDQAPGAEPSPEFLERMVPIVLRPGFESPEELIDLMRAAVPRFPEAELRRVMPDQFTRTDDGRWRLRFDPAMAAPASGMAPPPAEELLAMSGRIPCPTLLVRAAESEVVTPEMARRALAALPDGRLVEIPDADHYLPWEHPAALLAAVRSFLAHP
jgi:pimeloyl-ACP methyl ester carboxylesterase